MMVKQFGPGMPLVLYNLVVVGASAGGIEALSTVLGALSNHEVLVQASGGTSSNPSINRLRLAAGCAAGGEASQLLYHLKPARSWRRPGTSGREGTGADTASHHRFCLPYDAYRRGIGPSEF